MERCIANHSRLLLGVSLLCVSASTAASETIVYKYDALGRLIRTSQSGSVNNGVVTELGYDAAGNRTVYEVQMSSGSGDDSSNGGATGAGGSGSSGSSNSGSGGSTETPPSFSIAAASALEGAQLSFVVTKSVATTASYSVNWASADNTAISGSDYTAGSGTLTFGPADMTKVIVISTISNAIYEQTEFFDVNLSNATGGAAISISQGVGSISDVQTPNTPPIATADSGQVSCFGGDINVLGNDVDNDNDALAVTSVSGATGVTINGNGTIHVPGLNPSDVLVINYTIADPHGATASSTATVTWMPHALCGGGDLE